MPQIASLGTVSSLKGKAGVRGSGTYLMTHSEERIGQSGKRYRKLVLDDSTGRVQGFIWPESQPYVANTAHPCLVTVSASVQIFNNEHQLRVEALAPASAELITRATDFFSHQHCPSAALPGLTRLAQLENELPEPLSGFLRNVLLDPELGFPFLRCRASVKHHHSAVGGLLMHSTEMLQVAADLTRKTIPNDEWSPFVAQLSYLLHDMGKIRSVGELSRSAYGLVVRHEQLTHELLAPHLRWLERRDPRLANALRYVICYLATPAKGRGVADYVVAEIVEMLDQLSAASHNQRDISHLLTGAGRANFRQSSQSHLMSVPASSQALRAQ